MAQLLFVLVLAVLFNSSFQQDIDGRIRLVGGSASHEGRIEVRGSTSSYSRWGTICDDSFGMNDARVVCRMLGYTGAVTYRPSAYYGQGSGTIYMNGLRCTGTESTLFECPYPGWGVVYGCSHHEDVGVVCETSDNYGCQTVRISGSSSVQASRMTTYTMTGQLWNGRPLYRSSRWDYLYYYYNRETARARWHVGRFLGDDVKAMYLPNDTSVYADGTSGTWYLSNDVVFLANSLVRVSCVDPNDEVNGQWSTWGSWATCYPYCTCGDDACATNTARRTRQCITPPPRNGGLYCAGDSSQERLCACLGCESGYIIEPDGRSCKNKEGHRLSTGAIAGISFGVIIPSVLLIIGICYCKVCKRDKSVATVASEPSAPPPPYHAESNHPAALKNNIS